MPMHTVMKILLLLPFAALITAFMRNVVGLGTFGTFSPALLAMSFIYADWKTGLAILIVVVTVGLVGRLWLERLRLLMVPRLEHHPHARDPVRRVRRFDVVLLAATPSAEVVLLPMVILTMLIERFHVTVEEDGLVYAFSWPWGRWSSRRLCYLVLRLGRSRRLGADVS